MTKEVLDTIVDGISKDEDLLPYFVFSIAIRLSKSDRNKFVNELADLIEKDRSLIKCFWDLREDVLTAMSVS